jgi:hypothetical protein
MTRPPLGDLALDFRMFEREFKVIQTDNLSWEDGYQRPTMSYEKSFKGILVDKRVDKPEIQGIREQAKGSEGGRGARLLYIRLSQPWYPELTSGDIVIDTFNEKWRIIERYDYTFEANTIVWVIVRVDP